MHSFQISSLVEANPAWVATTPRRALLSHATSLFVLGRKKCAQCVAALVAAFLLIAATQPLPAVAAFANNKMGLDRLVAQVWQSSLKQKIDLNAERLAAGEIIRFNLPSDVGLAALLTTNIERLPSGNVRWIGTLSSGSQQFPAELILTKTGALGDVRTTSGRIRFENDLTSGQTVQLIPPAAAGEESCAVASLATAGSKKTSIAAQRRVTDFLNAGLSNPEVATVDIMFVYTTRVANKYGAQLSAVLDNVITTANTAVANSKTQISFRQVGVLRVSPRSVIVGDLAAALKAVAASDDASLPANADFAGVAAKRATLGADMVVFLTAFGDYSVGCAPGGGCMMGAAYQTSMESLEDAVPGKRGYAVVDVAARDLALTAVHEIGHLLGAGHDEETGGDGLFADSKGVRWNGGTSGDIMSYAVNRELMFSNPESLCGHQTCAIAAPQPTVANNVKALKAARFLVAGYQPTKAAPLPDMAGLWTATSDQSTVHLSQRGRVLTALWFHYDGAGRASWLSVPNCLVDGRRCSGKIYRAWTAPENATDTSPLATRSISSTSVGQADMDLSNTERIGMNVSIYDDQQSLSFARTTAKSSLFSEPVIDDQTTDGSWWLSMDLAPGLTVTRKDQALELYWFGFDTSGQGGWYHAPQCQLSGNNKTCSGDVFRSSTLPGSGGSRAVAQFIGKIALNFTSAYFGTVELNLAGRSSRTAFIEREVTVD